jgi:hypothetical protein
MPSPPSDDAARDTATTFPPEHYPLARHLAADIRFYSGLTRAGHPGVASLVRTVLANRGLWLLTFHRIGHFCIRRRDLRSPLCGSHACARASARASTLSSADHR